MARTLKDAFYDSQYRVGQGIYTRAVSQGDNSLTEANFTSHETFDTLIEDNTGALPEFVDSQVSMTDVSSSSLGMGKVAASQTAMDAVAASQTAMDAVMPSLMARTKLLSSTYVDGSVWSQEIAIVRFYEEFYDLTNNTEISSFPITTSDGYDISIDAETPSGYARSLKYNDADGFENIDQDYMRVSVDLTDASTLKFWAYDTSGSQPYLKIGGSEVWRDTGFNWQEVSLDVSGESGETEIVLGSNRSGYGPHYWTGFKLE